MSDRDIVISRSAELEKILKDKFGAEGSGLGQQAINIQHLLTAELSEKLRSIAGIRNKAAHEANFELYNPEKFIRMCDEAKAMLTALSTSTRTTSVEQRASNQSSKSTNPGSFAIPANLVKFRCPIIPYLFETGATFSCLTGQVVRLKERTYVVQDNKNRVTMFEQKIWLRLQNGQEEYAELLNFGLQAREGHKVTLLIGSHHKRSRYVAVYVHDLRRYFYNTSEWKKLFFGSLSNLLLLIMSAIFATVIVIVVILTFGIAFGVVSLPVWMITWVAAFFFFYLGISRYVNKQFSKHIAKVFSH